MDRIIFPLTGNEALAVSLAPKLEADLGNATMRHFPDGESYVKVNDRVEGKDVILLASLDYPDGKLLPLYFLAKTLKEMGARRVGLVAPYLAYMRQDKRFAPGEAVTSTHFAALISSMVDWIVTVDPHLHRYSSLADIYPIPNRVVSAAPAISDWIRIHLKHPVLIGQDKEGKDGVVEAIAMAAEVPFVIFKKNRRGDQQVIIEAVDMEAYKKHQPVLIDDIISTASTMTAMVSKLKEIGLKDPVCIGVHGLLGGSAYDRLIEAGARQVISCNTVIHESNQVDLSDDLSEGILQLIQGNRSKQNWFETLK